MGFPSTPGKPYRELADAALLRRATRTGQPAIVKRLPLKPPLNTPKPIRIDLTAEPELLTALPTNPRLGSAPTIPRPESRAPIPEPSEITLSSGSVRMSTPLDADDDYLSIAMVMPAPGPEPTSPSTRRLILVLAAIAIILLAIWLIRRGPTTTDTPAPTAAPAPARALAPARAAPLAAAVDPTVAPTPPTPHPPRRTRPASASVRSKAKAKARSRKPAAGKPAAATAFGFLTVDAVPYGTVWIDGKAAGQTPLIRVRLSAGNHDVRVVSSTGEGRSFAVDLVAGTDTRRRIRFEDKP